MKLRILPRFEYFLYTSIILIGIALDQLTKWLAVTYLKPVYIFPLFDGVLQLRFETNTGAAFGMFGEPNQRWIFMLISTIAIVAMAAYLFLGISEGKLSGVALALLISGGIGNMIDRVALGYVVDFIDFCLIDFAVFNGADSFVCIGAGLLMLSLLMEITKEGQAKK